MASTYTLNNGIELIGTGEQSGTWGDTTNTNLELIDTALDGQISLTLSSAGSSGSPNALPVSDGASSNGRNRLISYVDGGDLGATAYVQLTPNDAEKIIYIRNALSGSRSIIVFQGTYNASNDYEVPAGTTAVVYFNGGGTGAVAANVFNNAHFDALNIVGAVAVGATLTVGTSLNIASSTTVNGVLDEDNMASNSATKLSTQQSIKAYVDSQVGTVDTLAEVLANGNTTTTDQKIQFRDTGIYINSSADGQLDIVADTEIQIAATTVDLNGNLDVSGTALVTDVLTTTAATVFNGGFASPNKSSILVPDGTGDNDWAFKVSNLEATDGRSYGLKINAGSTTDEAFLIQDHDASNLLFKVLGNGALTQNGGAVFNEVSADVDFRVESNGNANMLFVDGGNNRVGVGTGSALEVLHVADSNPVVTVSSTSVDQAIRLELYEQKNGTADLGGFLEYSGASANSLLIGTTLNSTDTTHITLPRDGSGAATFNGRITADAGVDIDNINIDGTTIALSSGDLTLDVAGDIILDAGGAQLRFHDDGADIGVISNESNNLIIKTQVSDADILFKGNDNGSTITALTLDMSDAGHAKFNYSVSLVDNAKLNIGTGSDLQIYHDGSNSIILDQGVGNLQIRATNFNLLNADGNENYMSADDDGAVTLYYDNAAKLATTSTGATIRGDGDAILLLNTASDGGDKSLIRFGDNGDADAGYIDYDHGDNTLRFGVNAAERLRINGSGRQTYNGSSTANGHGNFVGEVGTSSKAIIFEHTNGGGEVGSIRTTSSNAVYYGDGSNLTGVGGSTTAGAVGTYALMWKTSAASATSGTTVAGSGLRFASTFANSSSVGAHSTAPSGTWRLMGSIGYYSTGSASSTPAFSGNYYSYQQSLFVRIS